MAAPLLDLSTIDLEADVLAQESLRAYLPQTREFELVDAICHLDRAEGIIVARKQWGAEPWWSFGHLPGRPLMPGVLMCEGGAQAASVLLLETQDLPKGTFIGLGGLDKVRFRGQVVPPGTIYYVSRVGLVGGTRLSKFPVQAIYEGKVVMDMTLLGMPI
ncbi:MAG: beta-hydroxyacyl-ACP dehydratase [Planctomycetes bacterium]|nr:beta-hydroxyacyl-ACP dehydratase [Planctomycetota bacterium]MCB9890865.1 beta-hydroxyacyl-ACP dehydratase [Planctomycetota bacterium]